MKRLTCILLTLCMAVSICCVSASAALFTDVPDSFWASKEIAWAVNKGVVNGTSATTFSPNDKTLRGQMTAILYRYAGEPAVSGASSFSDVKSSIYYANAASWAQKNNILISTVTGSNKFLGDTTISRAEFCAMVYNYAGYKSIDRKTASTAPFSDVKGLSSELLTAINWAYANGIVNGVDKTHFSPDSTLTRAQAVVMLYRYEAKFASGGVETNPSTEIPTKPDGTTVETTTKPDGSTTVAETKPDGSVSTVEKRADGTEIKTAQPVSGEITASVSVPKSVGSTRVDIPVSKPSGSMVAVIVHPDGTEEIVRGSVVTETGVALRAEGDVRLKIIDNAKRFNDMADHWAKDAVEFASSRELFNGVGNDAFGPDRSMTRGMVSTVLARLAGADTAGGETWYAKGTVWAVENGISDGTAPEQPVTREQLAAMLYRYAGSPAVSGELGFDDADSISAWARDAVRWCVDNGILNGVGGNRMTPQDLARRGQVAAMLMRFLQATV